jgi:hypothetical protein
MKKKFKLFAQDGDILPFKYICTGRSKRCEDRLKAKRKSPCKFNRYFRSHEMTRRTCPLDGSKFFVEPVALKRRSQ